MGQLTSFLVHALASIGNRPRSNALHPAEARFAVMALRNFVAIDSRPGHERALEVMDLVATQLHDASRGISVSPLRISQSGGHDMFDAEIENVARAIANMADATANQVIMTARIEGASVQRDVVMAALNGFLMVNDNPTPINSAMDAEEMILLVKDAVDRMFTEIGNVLHQDVDQARYSRLAIAA